MQVFKLYYKIFLRGLIYAAIIYVVVFSILTLMFTNFGGNPNEKTFSVEKCRVAMIDNDNSKLSTELSNYIKSNSNYVELNENELNNIKDVLFFRNAEYIITIPEKFGKSFMSDNKISLETMCIPNSFGGRLIDSMVNKYLNTIDLYIKSSSDMDIETAIQKTVEDLNIETKITLAKGEVSSSMPSFLYYFNYLPYPLLAIMILCVSGISLAINKIDIKRRNVCAPISTSKFNIALFLGNLTISIGVFLVFLVIGIVLYNKSMFTQSGFLVVVNALLFTVVCLSLSFLISNVSNEKTVSAISNAVSLGCCFLGGVFVPQEILSESVKSVAVINPVFWYVKANNALGSITTINLETMKPILFSMFVQICFAIAFLAVSLVIIKQKRTAEH